MLPSSSKNAFPNVIAALKLFMTICVSNASCGGTLSKLELFKNYLLTIMIQSRFNKLGILTIEHEAATQNINFAAVISESAAI